MPDFITGAAFGQALCEILGEPIERVQGIVITASIDGLVLVEISRLVNTHEANMIATLFEYFNLVKRDDYLKEHPQLTGGAASGAYTPDGADWSDIARQALAQADEVPDD